MANMTFKTNLLPNSDLGYSLGDSTHRWNIRGNIPINDVIPIETKTYPAYTCSADNEAKAVLFFGKINITSTPWQAPWAIHYRLYISTTENNTQGWYDCFFSVSGSTVNYYNYNNFYSTDYRPIYHHRLLYPKNGYSSYGAYFGVRVQSSRTPTSLARNFTLEILETKNCTIELLDSIKRFDEVYVTTNNVANSTIWYNTDYNGTSQGLQESGDTNSNDTGYYILTNGFRGTASTTYKLWRLGLFARTANGTYESFTNTSGTGTTKSKNPHGFLPEGKIYWNSAGGTDYSGTISFSPYQQYHSIDYRYTFNISTTGIPANAYTYLKWTYNPEDRLLYLADQWFATSLPTTEDGFIYQRIGSNYYGSADYRASLLLDNPYYIYKNEGIRVWYPPEDLTELNGISTISASGTSPLSLSATKTGTSVNITGSVAAATTSNAGIMAMSQANLNTMINQLGTGNSTPVDADYYISQYVGGGTSTTTYHRRPMSALYDYIKGKLNVTNNTINLSRNTETTIATIGGTAIKIKLPASDNTDTKVTQNNQTGNADYRIILSGNANDTPETTTANKSTNLKFNPSTKILKVGGSVEATGNLTLIGNAHLNNETYADSLTAGSLLVNGNTNFVQIPTAPTPANSSNDTSIATTAFVKNSISSLSNAMHFIGKATVTITDGSTTDPAISGYSTKVAGDVVIDKDTSYEYVWTKDGKWERLGPDGSYSLSTHTHGNISNDGKITSTATIANGDKLVIIDVDSTAGSKLTGSSITFDGSTETNCLTQKGTWKPFNNYTHPTGDGNLHVPATGTSNNGKFLKAGSTAGSLSWANAVTSITLKAGSGISLDTDNTAITTTGTRTITNSGVRSTTINGNYLRVNTNGTNADLTIPYATTAGKTNKSLKLANNRSFDGSAEVTLLTNDLTPAISKKYESTSYYASAANQENSTWYFMSIKPNSWYEPWRVRFKIHTYEPSYTNANSVSYCTVSGREQSTIYANWNERYDSAHYYTSIYPLKKAGFDAGLGHAIGISILYGYNYTSSAHYRTFEVDYFDCDNCTVTMLDTPVKWANWTGTGTTNYNGIVNMDAVSRGLQETGDNNDTQTIQSYYDRITAGTNGLKQYSLAMRDASGNWQSFTTDNGTGTSKTKNTTGFIPGDIIYLSMGSNVGAGSVTGYGVVRHYASLIDYRYTFNCGTSLTANKMVYIVGTIGTDGLFYLADTWWTQTLPTNEDGKVYIPVGIAYPDSGPYRGDFSGWHTPLYYKDEKIRPYDFGRGIKNITRSGTTFTVTRDDGSTFTFTQQDSNTTSFTITANATDGIFDVTGTNGTNAVTYAVAPYTSQQSKQSFDTSTTNPTRTDRLNYNGYLYATKLYSNGVEAKTKQTAISDSTGTFESTTATRFVYSVSQDTNGVISVKTRPLPTYNNYSLPTASTSTKGGIKVGAGLTMNGEVLNHSNSVTAKTSYGSTSTSANANGGSITVTDIQYDEQGHITASTDRTITLSQTTYTLAGLMGSTAKGSQTKPIYWDGSQFATITSYEGNASSATKLKNGRTFQIKDADNTNAGTASSAFTGENNLIINLPSTIKATLSGNASSASRLNITSTDNAIARFNGTNGTIQNSTATINDNGTMTIKGKLIVNPSYDTSNSYNEGVRINQASNGWANVHFGGAADSTNGAVDGGWLVGRRGAAGSTAGPIGDFTIEEQGSNGTGLTIHKDSNGATLYNSLTLKKAEAGQGLILQTNSIEYGKLYVATKGVAGTNTTTYTNPNDSSQTKPGYSGSVTGQTILTLGNNRGAGYNGSSYSSPGSAGTADNSQGYLRLYSSSTGYGDLTAYTGDKTRPYPSEGFAIPENKIGIMFRPGSSSYYTHVSYETSGNEALVAATQNAVTSFIFVNGESYANVAADRWTKLTGASGAGNAPGLQIKQNCISIGELIANGTTPTYKLNVNGTSNFKGNMQILNGGLEIKGHIAGDSSTTGHGLYSGGGYHNAYNNIILHGDTSTGSSGIAFISDKVSTDGTITNINQPSDRAFIQWHGNGITTYSAEGSAPTLATSGEANQLIIGVGNDANDQIRFQTPGRTSLLHQIGNTGYVIPDTNNTTGTVGSGTQPVWVEGGIIKNTTYTLAKSVPSDAKFTDTNNAVTQTNQTGNNDYRILLSGTADDTPRTEGSNKSTNLKFNPSTKILKVGGSIEATGNLSITGNSTLSGETSITSLTAGSLLVNGNANFTQIPTAPTPATSSHDTSIATTAFVKNNLGGLSGAMHFKGTTTTTMSDGLTTAAVTIGGASYTPSAGDVVLYSDSEFVWTGSAWERLGRDSSFKTTQSAVTTATAETTTATTFVYSVTQDANGVITVKTRPLPTYNNYSLPTASTSTKGGIKVGSGLTMSSETLNHTNSVTAKTSYGSTATTASANGGTIIVTDIKYDAQGHITASTDRTITLSQTTYGAEKGISLSSGKFGHSNTSITAKTAAAQAAKTLTWGGTFTLYEEKYDTYGHITGVASYNMTMPSNPNTDTKQNITLATTSKAYITGVTTTPTASATAMTGVADTDVYLTTTAGQLNAKTYLVDTHVILQYDSALQALEFAFI